MPELPDIEVYAEHVARRFAGRVLARVRLASPFLLRTALPPISLCEGRRLLGVSRLGKRIVFELEHELFLVLHLMVAGRLRLADAGAPLPKKLGLCSLDFDEGALVVTEAGSKRRASLHVAERAGLAEFDRGGLDVRSASQRAFDEVLTRRRHTLKRALTDPTLFDGIGNAYSDEILHAARLSPIKHTTALSAEERARLREACRAVLVDWTERLRRDHGAEFPSKVTAFRPGMAAHGRYRQPCPICQTPIARIVYADNETNYCPTCQTDGKLLADRSMSRLLGSDWPRSWEELEELRPGAIGKPNPGRVTREPSSAKRAKKAPAG